MEQLLQSVLLAYEACLQARGRHYYISHDNCRDGDYVKGSGVLSVCRSVDSIETRLYT